ncbi:hypothetical protein ACJIZ3_004930 [Penstemon smallii]|uniref:BAH domain-containing protein n=1 Tax=Penstemon smallii TaxID=265156 RepID=A0ABD3S3L9_9LAMI
MSPSPEVERLKEPEFKWGKKRGVGGKKKDVQFYESFTYDGVDYILYDTVFMYIQDELAPYIGKLVKIWENADKSKRIKVHWFFRPSEISCYLKDVEVLENELFFASGAGSGLANLNHLEAIAGKCNVVCISKDSRNPPPSSEELQAADYVFYRTFDVKSCTISDQMDVSVGGLEVKFVFNRKDSDKTLDFHKLDSNVKNDERNAVVSKETLKHAGKNSPQQFKNVNPDERCNRMLEKEHKVEKQGQHKLESSPVTEKLSRSDSQPLRNCTGGDVNSSKAKEAIGTVENRDTLGTKNGGCKVSCEKDKVQDRKSTVSQVQVEDGVKSANKSSNLEDTPSKRKKFDGKVAASNVKRTNGTQSAIIPGKDAAQLVTGAISSHAKSHSELVRSSVVSGKDLKLPENSSSFEKRIAQNFSACKERPSTVKVDSPFETARPLKTNLSPNEMRKSGYEPDLERPIQVEKLDKSTSGLKKRKLKTSADLSKENPNTRHDAGHDIMDTMLTKGSCPMEESPTKKAKFDGILEDCNNNTTKKLKKKISASETKFSPTLVTLNENKAKLRIDEAPSKENHDKNMDITSKGDEKEVGQKFEVTKRSIAEKSKWIKLPWEDRMKTAHDQGRLVLLQNLDPKYTSGEVEDIIWHAFKETCTAKMVQLTATSSPHSGQAFAIFKTMEAAERVMQKLDDGCLMLPNHRPLVGCTGVSPELEKQTTFAGHLAIDKARHQIQRELREAVSTSHYSQNNTIEYEMAMSWCLLQAKSDKWWDKLYERQKKEVNKLVVDLK